MLRREFLVHMMTATAALAVTRTALAQPIPPGAMPSAAYLAMATKGGLFLENTARDAHEKTGNPRIKAFSRAEVVEQVTLAGKIDRYTGGAAPMAGGSAPAGPGGLIGGLVTAPLAVAGGAVGAATGVAGAALGGPLGAMTSDQQKAEIAGRLASMQPGPAYDAAFVDASLQGHREALAIHGGYAQSGDDPGLRRIAQGALPLINRHIAQLSRMQAMMGARQG